MNNIEDNFVDKHRTVQMKYYDLMDSPDFKSAAEMTDALYGLIEQDPDFLDPYLELYEICQYEDDLKLAEEILDDAYNRAINLITDKNGNWPAGLLWGFLENRHIIRTIFDKAISLWDNGQTDEALELFRNLLKTNPNDNIGARDYILAIKMRMSFDDYEDRFNKGGYYDIDSVQWFEENAPKFPDEFGWWLDWANEQDKL